MYVFGTAGRAGIEYNFIESFMRYFILMKFVKKYELNEITRKYYAVPVTSVEMDMIEAVFEYWNWMIHKWMSITKHVFNNNYLILTDYVSNNICLCIFYKIWLNKNNNYELSVVLIKFTFQLGCPLDAKVDFKMNFF